MPMPNAACSYQVQPRFLTIHGLLRYVPRPEDLPCVLAAIQVLADSRANSLGCRYCRCQSPSLQPTEKKRLFPDRSFHKAVCIPVPRDNDVTNYIVAAPSSVGSSCTGVLRYTLP